MTGGWRSVATPGLGLLVGALLLVGAAPGVGGVPSWRAATLVEPAAQVADGNGSLYGVSCPTTRTCVAVDAAGNALWWEGGRWSRPHDATHGTTLSAVSCPSTRTCVAMTAGGGAVTSSGTSWGSTVPVGPAATYRLSCPTATFCAAVGANGMAGGASVLATYDGRTWSSSRTAATGARLNRVLDVSCPAAGVCTAVNLDGSVLTFTRDRWVTDARSVEAGATSVSCPTASFCMVVGVAARRTLGGATWFATRSAQRWRPARPIPGLGPGIVLSVSCGSAGMCMAVGLNGKAALWRNGRWSPPVTVFGGGYSATVDVSCAGANACVAVNAKGQAAVFG